ncbi:acyltransferase family protein, partial [Xanthomonas citri pv. citri]|nr:acyltransferase family protein [Xanthomonas citri pv. citri]
GGWLGVDLFFVLSGYLITSLLVREYARSGRVDLRRFWSARARRLLPSLITVLIAVLAAAAFWTPSGRRGSVALDTLATLFYVQNWRLLASNEAYFDANGVPSPL